MWNVVYVFLIAVQFLTGYAIAFEDASSPIDVDSLSILPLDALLAITKELDHNETLVNDNQHPQALPLTHDGRSGPKKTGVGQFFNVSVTAMAFLAFGGYLIFLILAAMRSRQPLTNPQFMPSLAHRKKKRKRHPHFYTSRGRSLVALSDVDGEVLYQALVHLAEGYAKIEQGNM